MAGIALLPSFFQFLDDNGDPLNGGKLYTYAAGTSTPLTTYFDVDLDPAHANANPIILDAAGRCVIYVDNTGASVKILLTDANDVTVVTQDEIPAAAVA